MEPKTTAQVIDEITIFDEWGFQVKPERPWEPESQGDRRERLTKNLAYYREYLKNGTRFPQEINDQRLKEMQELNG